MTFFKTIIYINFTFTFENNLPINGPATAETIVPIENISEKATSVNPLEFITGYMNKDDVLSTTQAGIACINIHAITITQPAASLFFLLFNSFIYISPLKFIYNI